MTSPMTCPRVPRMPAPGSKDTPRRLIDVGGAGTDKHFEYLKDPLSKIGTAVSFRATPVMTAVT
jgi:hypothetical protein